MAEKGNYTIMSNELWEALARTRISGEERQVLDVIIRQTLGFQDRKTAWITASNFILATGLPKSSIYRAIAKLLSRNIIYKSVTKKKVSYGFHKDFGQWQVVTKKKLGYNKVTKRLQKCNHKVTILSMEGGVDSSKKRKLQNPKEKFKESIKETVLSEQKTSLRKPRVIKTDTDRLFNYFCETFKEKTGELYCANFGKDKGIIKVLTKIYKVERIKELMTLFFATDDEFIKDKGYTIGIFRSKINMFLTQKTKKGNQYLSIEELEERGEM